VSGWAIAAALSMAACAGLGTRGVLAQTPASPPGTSAQTPLPPLVVETPKKAAPAKKKAKAQPAQAPATPAAAAPSSLPPADAGSTPRTETATGPVKGIVATRSATGTKTDTPLIETPQSISVITADRVAQQGATTISEALGYTAGVRANVYGLDTRFDWLAIRGFDAYLPGFFVDGMLMRNNNAWAVWKVEPYGAERIEVLKGPPSVLYGQANVGGMVNVISKRPLDEPLNEVQLKVGNHNRVETDFDFSGPATKDGKLLYRLTGVILDTDTEVDFTDQQRVYIAPAVTWRPNSSTTLTLLGQYMKEDDVPNNRFLPPEGIVKPNPNGPIPRDFFTGEPGYDTFQQEQWSIGYQLEHRIDPVWTVRQYLRYRKTDVDYKTVYGRGLEPVNPSDPDSPLNPRRLSRNVFTSFEQAHSFTMDNQVQADLVTGAIKHTLLVGADYQRNVFDRKSGNGDAESIDMYNPTYGAPITTPPNKVDDSNVTLSQTGIYLQEQAKIFDRWVVTLGGRYDFAKNETDDRLTGRTPEREDEAFTWRAGVLYLAPAGFAPYFSYSESFFPTTNLDPVTRQPLAPETGHQYEVGIKYQPSGMRALFTLAAFDITRENYVTFEPDPPFAPRQTGEIRSRGIEFEATVELARGLDLIASYTWLPTFEITASANPAEIGKRWPTVPEHTASLWMHYRLQNGSLAGFGFGGGMRYIGETFGDLANSADMKVPDFTLFDGVVDYEKDGWRFALNVVNIADEPTFTCDSTCYYGAGRSVIFSARKRW
jgi:iron complex outermembrane receptor protein